MIRVLLVNHGLNKFCGIYAYGIRMYNILKNSTKYKFLYCECNNLNELLNNVTKVDPAIIIYNQTIAIMPWASEAKNVLPEIIHIGMTHDVVENQMTSGNVRPFDYRLSLDHTLLERENWFSSIRPLVNHFGKFVELKNKTITLGSFGFYFRHKNFHKIINLAFSLNKEVNLNFNINKAHFSSEETKKEFDFFIHWAKNVTDKTKINLNINSNYLTDEDLIDELSKNDLNILLYEMNYGMGPASALDYCIAAGRPVLLSDSYQFRHVKNRLPSIINSSIDDAIAAGNSEVLKIRNEWSAENFLKDHERIINEVQNRKK